MLSVIRIWLPATICAVGLVVIAVGAGNEDSLHIGVPIFSAGASVYLLNFLFRVGASSDQDRGTEEDARQFHSEQGRWPTPEELKAYSQSKREHDA